MIYKEMIYMPQKRLTHSISCLRLANELIENNPLLKIVIKDVLNLALYHDIGYSTAINNLNFHSVDGAVFLENKRGEALLEALVDLSHILGLRVIAEGVENQKAYAWLKAHACDGMQGYYFCRPLPAVELEMLLEIPQSN